jgi:phosphomannomutase
MTLIKTISGIRGTIGGKPDEGLSPLNIVKFTSSYASWLRSVSDNNSLTVVVGRDARISGKMISSLVISTLMSMGINVIEIGLATTPTTEIAVAKEGADGGIIITASHNPKEWNALKLLNGKGEFLNADEGQKIIEFAEKGDFYYAGAEELGTVVEKDYTSTHIEQILDLDLVDEGAIEAADFFVAVDAVNSVGGIVMPRLLKSLGVTKILEINCKADGRFAHTPEPIPENLAETSSIIREHNVDVGFVVDPDVDRLAVINEDGSMFNEEYTLVAVADYVLSKTPGNTVSNLSSTRALRDITEKYGQSYVPSAVGEVNVITKMKETNAVIGGEGNGGVIYPACHYGRDALAGAALFLTSLAKSGMKCSQLRKTYPDYFISKNKLALTPDIDVDALFKKVKDKYAKEKINDIDGIKIDFTESWIHLRKSNTEPVIRVYAEAKSEELAKNLASKIITSVKTLI